MSDCKVCGEWRGFDDYCYCDEGEEPEVGFSIGKITYVPPSPPPTPTPTPAAPTTPIFLGKTQWEWRQSLIEFYKDRGFLSPKQQNMWLSITGHTYKELKLAVAGNITKDC